MKRLLTFLTAVMIFVGCAPQEIDNVDWCYIYDFSTGYTDFTVSQGQILGFLGLTPNEYNRIIVSYDFGRFVQPLYVIPTITRAPAIFGDVTIDAVGTVYGLYVSGQAVMGSGDGALSPAFENTSGIAGSTINMTLEGDQAFTVTKLEIRGMGSNPFDRNDCHSGPYEPSEEPTIGTPSPIPTLTPSLTASATNTASNTPEATATNTLTPSPTPTLQPCDDINITVNKSATSAHVTRDSSTDDNTELPSGYLEYQTGEGWAYEFQTTTTVAGVTINAARFNADAWAKVYLNGSLVATSSLASVGTGGTGAFQYISFTPQIISPGGTLRVEEYENAGGPLVLYMINATIDVTDCDQTPTPSPTPTASNTPDILTQTSIAQTATASTATPSVTATSTTTLTPSDAYFCAYNFLDNAAGFTATNGTFDEGGDGWQGASVGGTTVLQIQKTISTTTVYSITLTWIVEIPAATLVITSPYGPTSSINVDVGTKIQTGSGTKTGVTALNFGGSGTSVSGKRLRLTRAEIRGTGNRPTGASCQNPTATPNASATHIPSVTPRASTRTPIVPPTLNVTPNYVTATPGGPTLTPGGPAITSTPGLEAGPANDLGQVGNGLGGSGGIGNGTGDLMGDYVGQAGSALTGLFGAFADAHPEPVPGLPLCMSNPTAHDWCAIIYIINNTVLADGTPGVLIVPILQIFVYIYLFIFFVRGILWIARRGESMTNVT